MTARPGPTAASPTAGTRTVPAADGPRVAVVGHVGADHSGANGQILRTRIVVEEVRRRLGAERVRVVDTGAGRRALPGTLRDLLRARRWCSDLVFMPGSRGLRLLLPLYARWKRRRGIRLHYLVVGGWLPAYLRARPRAVAPLRACDGVYVQTRRMLADLRAAGLDNARLLPNFRRFAPDRPRSGPCGRPLRFVFLSRMIPEKGVALAVEAVRRVNAERGEAVATLDLWGPVAPHASAWFEAALADAGPATAYRGVLPPADVHARLTAYDVMLFPTWYSGEGFPGVILDAMIAGIPVIASDWQDNAEFVEDGRTGFVVATRDVGALAARVRWAVDHPDEVMRMKRESAARADAFHVDAVFPQLLAGLGWAAPAGATVAHEPVRP